jgi:hypothetical protein
MLDVVVAEQVVKGFSQIVGPEAFSRTNLDVL